MFLKKIVPASLFGRFLMILVIPSILLPVVSAYVFYARHWKSVNRNMISSLVGEVVMVTDVFKLPEEEALLHYDKVYKNLGLNVRLFKGDLPEQYQVNQQLQELTFNLEARLSYPFHITFLEEDDNKILIKIQIDYDKILALHVSKKRIANPTTSIYVLFMATASVILFLIAVIFTKNQIRSIANLSKAMERYGQAMEIRNFKPSGAKEVRLAGENFLKMRESIFKHVNQKTEMLAGISHDLRTPLTRMNLELALIEGMYDVTELKNDIQEMEYMIDEYLSFARGEEGEEKHLVDMKELLGKIIERYKNYEEEVSFLAKETCSIALKEKGFIRCFSNLIDNALRYGGMAKIYMELQGSSSKMKECVIMVDDNGPGIAEEEREKIFNPFYRIDGSRNSDTGGVGLGMAITRDIITAHGGSIILTESPDLGGLRVIIRLPV